MDAPYQLRGCPARRTIGDVSTSLTVRVEHARALVHQVLGLPDWRAHLPLSLPGAKSAKAAPS